MKKSDQLQGKKNQLSVVFPSITHCPIELSIMSLRIRISTLKLFTTSFSDLHLLLQISQKEG